MIKGCWLNVVGGDESKLGRGEILWRISKNSSSPFSFVELISLSFIFNVKSYLANVAENLVSTFYVA